MEFNTPTIVAVIIFSSIALFTDLRNRRIPNWLTVSAAITGLVWHIFQNGLAGAGTSLGGFATGFGLLLLLWALGGGGGGDVKLMGAVGAWLGAFSTICVFIGSAGFAVVCSLVVIMLKRHLPTSGKKLSDSNEGSVRRITVPYALPVSMAIWCMFVISIF